MGREDGPGPGGARDGSGPDGAKDPIAGAKHAITAMITAVEGSAATLGTTSARKWLTGAAARSAAAGFPRRSAIRKGIAPPKGGAGWTCRASTRSMRRLGLPRRAATSCEIPWECRFRRFAGVPCLGFK